MLLFLLDQKLKEHNVVLYILLFCHYLFFATAY